MNINLDELRLQHFTAHLLIRKVAELELKRECKKGINSKRLAELQQIINTAINGERESLGMRHLDLNVAIEELTRAGYIVTENIP